MAFAVGSNSFKDGDYLGNVRRLDIAYVPDALTMVVP